jgi:long-subunit acyl-CoA synthetase (AMP-forming)
MTENCAICTSLEATRIKPFSVGGPAWGAEVKIEPETGEILMKAPYMMKEYYKSPELTLQTIQDGWLYTGDQGYLDEDGDLFITGRVKDTFKTTKGKFIVPAPIEWHFDQDLNIEQVCLMGIGCPQPVALVVLSEMGMSKSKAELSDSLGATLKSVNAHLNPHEKIATIAVVNEPWSTENGLLTPTLKVKRSKMNERYRNQLVRWCEDNRDVVFEN